MYAGTGSPVQRRSNSSSNKTAQSASKSPPADGQPPANRPPTRTNLPRARKTARRKKIPARRSGPRPCLRDAAAPATRSGSEPRGASAPSQPAAGENSVFRIAADGTVREIFREKVMILSMLKLNGRFLLGTGSRGSFSRSTRPARKRPRSPGSIMARFTCLLQRHNGSIVLGTGDPGKLYVLEDNFAAKGTVVSEVLRRQDHQQVGRSELASHGAAGHARRPWRSAAATCRNPTTPGATGPPSRPTPEASKVPAPTARYLQYRVTLASDNPRASPEVHGLTLRYKTTNQAPEITSFEVPDLDAANLDNPRSSSSLDRRRPQRGRADLYSFLQEGWLEGLGAAGNGS